MQHRQGAACVRHGRACPRAGSDKVPAPGEFVRVKTVCADGADSLGRGCTTYLCRAFVRSLRTRVLNVVLFGRALARC